jgi:anti-sigma B factor antagonist
VQDFQLLLSQPHARVLELRLAGEIDLATVPPLREATRTATASRDYDCLVFDLSDVSFMDSSALHVLAAAHTKMTSAGGSVRVICGSPNLLKVFELTGLAEVLPVFSERSDALAVAA